MAKCAKRRSPGRHAEAAAGRSPIRARKNVSWKPRRRRSASRTIPVVYHHSRAAPGWAPCARGKVSASRAFIGSKGGAATLETAAPARSPAKATQVVTSARLPTAHRLARRDPGGAPRGGKRRQERRDEKDRGEEQRAGPRGRERQGPTKRFA